MHKHKRCLVKKHNQAKGNLVVLLFIFGALILVGAVSYSKAFAANEKYRQKEDAKMKQLEEKYNKAKSREYNKYQADTLVKIEKENKNMEKEVQEKAAKEMAEIEKTTLVFREGEKAKVIMEKTVELSQDSSLPAQSFNNINMTLLGALESTAYTHTGEDMANGERPHIGAVACNLVSLGTRIYIEGLGYYTVKDRIGYGSQLDIFFNTESECVNYGRRTVSVYIVN